MTRGRCAKTALRSLYARLTVSFKRRMWWPLWYRGAKLPPWYVWRGGWLPFWRSTMPSKTPKQARTMAAAAHDPKFAKRMGIPQAVARDFNQADVGSDMLHKGMMGGTMGGGGLLTARRKPRARGR